LNLFLKQKIREGRIYDAAIHFDYLRRGNKKTTDPIEMKKYTINQQSWDLTAMIVMDLKEYELCKFLVDGMTTSKKINLSEEIRKKVKEHAEKADFEGLFNHLIKKGPKSKNILEQEEVFMKKQKFITDSFALIQPSFDRVPNIPERDI
jgi:hypothetical protein